VSPAQRAQVLYLHHVDGVSIVLIAAMMGLSRSTVQRVLQDEPAARPLDKGRIERPLHDVHERLLRLTTAVPQRPHRRERRRGRT
jgi:hypothetical protein